MREILFKAKRLDNGEWVEGSLISFADGGRAILPSKSAALYKKGASLFSTVNCLEVDPSAVCQYTELTDRNGKKIFEEDIIIVRDESGEVYRFSVAFGQCGGTQNVGHDVGYMGFYFEPNNEETKYCMKHGARNDLIYWMNAYNCEVIGSIYDGEDGQNE